MLVDLKSQFQRLSVGRNILSDWLIVLQTQFQVILL